MRYFELLEGRVFRIDWGSPVPVMVISNPSPPQARTLVEIIRKKETKIYIRGILVRGKMVYVWDGYQMTHDDVRQELFPTVRTSDLTTFEIANYTQTGLFTADTHAAKVKTLQFGDHIVGDNSFVGNILQAIGEVS